MLSDDPIQSRRTWSEHLAALAYSDFQKLWTASFTAGAAAWALIVARGWLVYTLSDSSLWVGAVTFAAMVPRAVVTPFTGYLSDRFDRRSVLAAMFSLNVLHNLVLGLLVLSGHAEPWLLLVLALVNGSARAAQMPAAGALVPNLVPRPLLLNAIALNQGAVQGSRLVGPAAIAPLVATIGIESAFFLCTGFYVISLVQTLRIRTPSTGEIDRRQSLTSNMAAGIVYMYRTPVLRSIVLLTLFHCGLTMSFESLLPVLSRQELNAEGVGFTYLMMSVGAGALLSVLVIAGIRGEATKGRLFLYLGLVSGMTPAILGMATNMPMALIGAACMGVSHAGYMTLTHTMIQAITPDGIRGRVGGVYSVHIGGTMAVANLANGGLADVIDAQLLLLVAGALFVGTMLVSTRDISLRRIYSGGLQQAAPAAAD
jgi:MFS family permease